MSDEEWIKTLADGRRVKFTYQELPADGAFITAQLAGNSTSVGVGQQGFEPCKNICPVMRQSEVNPR
jgi:hypothetical protein